MFLVDYIIIIYFHCDGIFQTECQRYCFKIETFQSITTSKAWRQKKTDNLYHLYSKAKMMKATQNHHRKQRRKEEKMLKHKKRQAYINLIQGAALYGICVSLPAILGVLVRLYENQSYGSSNMKILLHRIGQYFGSDNQTDLDFKSMQNITDTESLSGYRLLSEKINDFQLICVLSVFLAALRLTIFYLLVPVQIPENKQNSMIRCKSVGMLRSYDLTSTSNSYPNFKTRKTIRTVSPSPSRSSSPQRNSRKKQRHEEELYISSLRYATALYRFLYTFITSISAFYLFRNAVFWPIYLGGKPTSSTANCWDLSGGIAFAGVDQDFDHFNSRLRYYFVAQASYQIQSFVFHCFLFFGKNWKLQKSWKDFIRTVAEHMIALILLSGSFLFSSWRRLTAVAMFAMDISGLFLHLLQFCLNYSKLPTSQMTHLTEEEDSMLNHVRDESVLVGNDASVLAKKQRIKSRRKKSNLVWFLHRFLVLPTFM